MQWFWKVTIFSTPGSLELPESMDCRYMQLISAQSLRSASKGVEQFQFHVKIFSQKTKRKEMRVLLGKEEIVIGAIISTTIYAEKEEESKKAHLYHHGTFQMQHHPKLYARSGVHAFKQVFHVHFRYINLLLKDISICEPFVKCGASDSNF